MKQGLLEFLFMFAGAVILAVSIFGLLLAFGVNPGGLGSALIGVNSAIAIQLVCRS